MIRSIFACLLVVACASGEESSSSSGAAATSSGAAATAAAFGTACEKYYGTCCKDLAEALPAGASRDQAIASCNSAKSTAENSLQSGTTAAQLESSCEQGIAAAQMAGRCK